jgi:hypothetical protein
MEGQPWDAGDARHPVRRPEAMELRISDEDRHKVAELLRQAAGEGRIDLEELDERLEATYRAKTYGELVPITADLPAARSAAPAPVPPPRTVPTTQGPAVRYSSALAIMSETRRSGVWLVEEQLSAFALMGSVVLDMRLAQFESREVVVTANAVMGEVQVIVDAATTVIVEGVGVMGDFSEQRPKVPFDAERGGPVVRVRGFALMGGVHVQRKGPPGEGLRRHLGWAGH